MGGHWEGEKCVCDDDDDMDMDLSDFPTLSNDPDNPWGLPCWMYDDDDCEETGDFTPSPFWNWEFEGFDNTDDYELWERFEDYIEDNEELRDLIGDEWLTSEDEDGETEMCRGYKQGTCSAGRPVNMDENTDPEECRELCSEYAEDNGNGCCQFEENGRCDFY